MSKAQAKKIVEKYARVLKKAKFSFVAIYLFGSSVKGKAHEGSDIDVAVVSSQLKKNRDKDRLLLWKLRRDVDVRIEPHGFSPERFKQDADPMVYEIKETGVRVA